jgi:hypothetical protein
VKQYSIIIDFLSWKSSRDQLDFSQHVMFIGNFERNRVFEHVWWASRLSNSPSDNIIISIEKLLFFSSMLELFCKKKFQPFFKWYFQASQLCFSFSSHSFNFFMRNDHSFLLISWNFNSLLFACSTLLLVVVVNKRRRIYKELKFHFISTRSLSLAGWAWTWAVGGFVKYF